MHPGHALHLPLVVEILYSLNKPEDFILGIVEFHDDPRVVGPGPVADFVDLPQGKRRGTDNRDKKQHRRDEAYFRL